MTTIEIRHVTLGQEKVLVNGIEFLGENPFLRNQFLKMVEMSCPQTLEKNQVTGVHMRMIAIEIWPKMASWELLGTLRDSLMKIETKLEEILPESFQHLLSIKDGYAVLAPSYTFVSDELNEDSIYDYSRPPKAIEA